jgi:RNA polymerase sigma-70 factor (ECF subfamily)
MEGSNKKSDKQIEKLVDRWLKGDNAAFGELYDYYIDNLYRFVYFKVKDNKDVEDLVEISFLKVFENKDKFNKRKSSFGTWLYNIARNTVIDFYRTKKEVEEIPETHTENDGEDIKDKVDGVLNSEILKKALEEVSEDHRELIIFRFIEELSYSEVSKILKKKEGTVRVMQYRALNDLKAVLERMGYSGQNF